MNVRLGTLLIGSLAIAVSACGGGGGGGGSDGLGLDDRNEDRQIKLLAFGNSITRGVGDGSDSLSRPPLAVAGYPARLETLLGVPVDNAGNPGELAEDGRDRLPSTLAASNPDYVILLEGVNDILVRRSDDEIIGDLAAMVGTTLSFGAQPILATLPPTCCDRRFSQPESRIRGLNSRIRAFATTNQIPLIDFFAAFVPDPQGLNPPFDPDSGLIHEPEGLHPTPLGYDLMAATAAAIF